MKKLFLIVSIITMLSVVYAQAEVHIPILLYHHVVDEYAKEDAHINITPDMLEAHFDALLDAGYNAITFDEYYRYATGTGELPEKPVIITFDDGYESNYVYAYPFLMQRNMKATIFIITSTVGEVENVIPHFTWEEAAEMLDSGVIKIGSHTHTHRSLTTLSRAEVRKELRLSKYLIEKNLGIKCDYLAFPFGLYDSDIFDDGIMSGYKLLSRVGDRGHIDKYSIGGALNRLTVWGTTTPEELLNQIEDNL